MVVSFMSRAPVRLRDDGASEIWRRSDGVAQVVAYWPAMSCGAFAWITVTHYANDDFAMYRWNGGWGITSDPTPQDLCVGPFHTLHGSFAVWRRVVRLLQACSGARQG